LPGSEGVGVADVLVADRNGKARHDFKGRLSFSWPKLPTQDVLNPQHAGYDPLFPLGYGLNYTSAEQGPTQLAEDVDGVQKGGVNMIALHTLGRPLAPWEVYIDDGDTPQLLSGPYAALPSGTMSIKTEDKQSQEDALKVSWTGENAGAVAISGGPALDISSFLKADGIISFDIKADSLPSKDVYFQMTCGEGCIRKVSLTSHIRALVGQGWQRLSIKL